jgi:hypothetical protein
MEPQTEAAGGSHAHRTARSGWKATVVGMPDPVGNRHQAHLGLNSPPLDPSVPQDHLINKPLQPAVFSDQLRIISKPRPHQICNSATGSRSV